MKKVICVLLLIGMQLPLVACNEPWKIQAPVTEAGYGGWGGFRFKDTKNNDVKIDAEYNPDTKQAKLKAEIRNNASDVVNANVVLMQVYAKQMELYNEEMRIHGENIRKNLAEIKEMIAIGADAANLSVGPNGLQIGNQLAAPEKSEEPKQPDPPADAE